MKGPRRSAFGVISTEPPGWDARGRSGTGYPFSGDGLLVPCLISVMRGMTNRRVLFWEFGVGVGWMNKRVAYGSQR